MRLLGLLDGGVSEALRRGSPVELSRARLLVGVVGLLLVCSLIFLTSALVTGNAYQRGMLGMTGVCAAGFLGALVLLRWGTSTRIPALLLSSFMTLGVMASAYSRGEQIVAVHATVMLIPLFTVYLLGVRLGMLFAALTAVHVGLVHPLTFGYVDVKTWGQSFFAALFVVCAGLVCWLFTAARDEALTALEDALRTLRDREGKLASVLEHTQDVVCSLDAQGRLLTMNPALRKLYQRLQGRELWQGEVLIPQGTTGLPLQWQPLFAQVLAGRSVQTEVNLAEGAQPLVLDVSLEPILGAGGAVEGVTVFGRDITARKEAEARLSELHRNLLDVSRQAGMAEIATGVLHNVGNTLNSVNVSAGLVAERLRALRVAGVARAAGLLEEHAHDLPAFFSKDPRGQQFPGYLRALSGQLSGEQAALLEEVRALNENVDHIKAVVSMQQAHARSAAMVEPVMVPQLLDDALRLHAVSFERLGIQLRTEYGVVPPVMVDRHKLLQVLLNLLSNARHALLDSGRPDKRITLRVACTPEERLRIEVADNGVGVAPEHMARMFSQGFTTKKAGHGFGLHISALAAEEMGGSLTCSSAGRGQGATFIIELPVRAEESKE
jgi:PAS domain S-box-containing protein